MQCSLVAPNVGVTERHARAPVSIVARAGYSVTGAVKAFDSRAIPADDLTICVDNRTSTGVHSSGCHDERIVRAFAGKRIHGRSRLVVAWVRIEVCGGCQRPPRNQLVVTEIATLEVFVHTGSGEAIELLDFSDEVFG